MIGHVASRYHRPTARMTGTAAAAPAAGQPGRARREASDRKRSSVGGRIVSQVTASTSTAITAAVYRFSHSHWSDSRYTPHAIRVTVVRTAVTVNVALGRNGKRLV